MGCGESKVGVANNNTEVAAKPDINAKPEVDPRLPLTPKQLFLLKQSWKSIKRNTEETGIELLVQ